MIEQKRILKYFGLYAVPIIASITALVTALAWAETKVDTIVQTKYRMDVLEPSVTAIERRLNNRAISDSIKLFNIEVMLDKMTATQELMERKIDRLLDYANRGKQQY